MDIIAEILDAEKMANKQIEEAQAKSKEILAFTAAEENRLMSEAEQDAEDKKKSFEADADREISAAADKARKDADEKISALDKLCAENKEKWAEDIFRRIIAID